MNWYKIAKDFKERNIINHKIRYLEGIRKTLIDISKIIFQSGKTAKNINRIIITSKKISSYPGIKDILASADLIALDSPWKFSAFCHQAVVKIEKIVSELKRQRKIFIEEKLEEKKGWE